MSIFSNSLDVLLHPHNGLSVLISRIRVRILAETGLWPFFLCLKDHLFLINFRCQSRRVSCLTIERWEAALFDNVAISDS